MTLTLAQQEAKYDAERDGSAYATPIPLSAGEREILKMLLELSPPDPDELGSAADAAYEQLLTSTVTSIGQILCESDEDDQIEVTRTTHHSDGSRTRDPWTTFTFGEASIDLHDSGVGNVCLAGDMFSFTDAAQVLDLALLLADARLLEALDPSSPELAS